jgi:hypothetical protein
MNSAGETPYRTARRSLARGQLVDGDIVGAMLLASPVFVGVVAGTVTRGQAWGSDATVCGALVFLAGGLLVSALRARR